MSQPNQEPKLNAIQQTETDIREACHEIQELLISKNRSYGDSALNPVRIFSKSTASEAIRVRLDDKLSRLKTGNTEFNEDTILDILGYLILARIAKKRGL